jgi:hypothetical protein
MDPNPDPGAQKHVDPVDPVPEPEHCYFHKIVDAVVKYYHEVAATGSGWTVDGYRNPIINLEI